MACRRPRSTSGPPPLRRALLAASLAAGAAGSQAIANIRIPEDHLGDPLVDEVLCPISLIQTTLRQVRLRDGVEEEIEVAQSGLPSHAVAPRAGVEMELA
eukprot:CAMPEP_0175801332 /NCGR_PEP_ID=MMETSP0097-20121207/87475_1 /TAXON_ID=311494 /ORGANISM="Alexandrium monilatum, Strain CCMP3105" /LENGTH=99 /DNA_ID=CAMNT_0017112643 /DNA_START=63 /DNA_END=359 /DNA_ORIENTATION=+